MLRKLPPAGYLLALICFLLPFVEVSCNGQKVVSLTGMQLLSGPQVGNGGGMFAPPKQRANPETSVVIAFVAGIAGLVLSVLKQRRTDIIGGVCGVVAAGSLLALQQSILSGAPPQALGLIQIQYQPAYFLSLLMFFAGAALLFYSAFAKQSVPAVTVTAVPAPYPPPSPPVSPPKLQANVSQAPSHPPTVIMTPLPSAATLHFCSRCGQQLAADARFCAKCGSAQS
ncbi:MAG: zinc ribbon domain-containing protein [Candidatus Korobacteraceae bacterium]